jgi:hypothetical protein
MIGQPKAGDTHPDFVRRGRGMALAEELYVIMVVAALTLFGGTLAVVSWVERRWARENNRS